MTQEQTRLLQLLEAFAALCRRHDLRYYLAGGTLLGAVRHKGFIPWDDDIDVMMPASDYERFLTLEGDLPAGLIIQSERSDDNYSFLFAKLCDTGVPFITQNRHGPLGIYIDIFPIAPARRPTRRAEFQFNAISVVNYVLQVKCGWARYIPYKRKAARLGYWTLDRLTKRQLRNLRRSFVRRLSAEGTGYLFSPGGVHKGIVEFYPNSWFDETVFMDFEGKKFPVPVGWDDYLKQLYGDYMILPDVEQRVSGHKDLR